jgi:hypothetical protein
MVFFKGFCDVAKVVSFQKKTFSQIWLHTRYESKVKKTESFYIIGYLLQLIIKI